MTVTANATARKEMRIHDGSLIAVQSKPEANGELGATVQASRRRRACLARRLGFVIIFDYKPVIRCRCSGYRSPSTAIFEAALSMSRKSSDVSCTATDPMFSSKRDNFVVPGIGTIQGFCARSQASAI